MTRRLTRSLETNGAIHSRFKLSRNRWWRWFRRICWRLSTLQGNPDYLARGLAVGVFAGWFPFFGLQIAFGVTLAIIVRGDKLLAAAGTWVSNPLTSIPIYFLSYRFGQWLLGSQETQLAFDRLQSPQDFLELGIGFVGTLLMGCFVLGVLGAIASYFISLRLIRQWHRRQILLQQSVVNSPPNHPELPPPPVQK
ncbi:MAG: DUF2062 domain-containing protein [Microcoleaceae cyanobacterium]